jgi:hypothetical protein
MSSHELHCLHCGERERVTIAQLLARLRAAGVLKRAVDPEEAEILVLAEANRPRLACTACGETGLSLAELPDDGDEDWGDPKPCERCGTLIPAERLALFPAATLCVKCQQAEERGDSGEAEYCERCGSMLQLRKAASGVTRYVQYCPACGR